MVLETKHCSKCGQDKTRAEFSPRSKGSQHVQSWCKNCLSTYSTKRAADSVRRRRGLPLDHPSMRGVRDGLPVGTCRIHRGYVLEKAPSHHRADRYGWVPQHILVAEKLFGIPITREFTVHHRNNDKADNRPENLDLRLGNHGVHGDVIDVLLRDERLRARAVEVLRGYGLI